MKQIILIVHNLRSTHNVGSILRTADGMGVEKVYLTGYTPYPTQDNDTRLPHISRKIDQQIHKTALGAEKTLTLEHREDIFSLLDDLKQSGFVRAAIEQAPTSTELPEFTSPEKIALVVGREVEGIEAEILKAMDLILEIPMLGKKESYNVAVATAMALYQTQFVSAK